MKIIEEIVNGLNNNITDIHIKANGKIYYRERGLIYSFNKSIQKRDIEEFIENKFNLKELERYEKLGSLDKGVKLGQNRLRINLYRENDRPNMAIRILKNKIIEYEKLRLPKEIEKLIYSKQGLILITGATGSGKSTTVASIISEINYNSNKHIILIEDPIEYIHINKKSIVTQIEIGKDAKDFATALRACLRQDPDIIVIGEIRDKESLEIALRAAETGHLVLTTLHTNSASETIERVTEMYNLESQSQIRYVLSRTLKLIISQELYYDGSRLYPIFEIMVSNSAVRNTIRMNKTFQLDNIIRTNRRIGMIDKENYLREIGNNENII